MSIIHSFHVVHLFDCLQECPDADVLALSSELLGPAVHGVELSYFVAVANFLKESLDLLPCPRHLEIVFSNAHLGESAGEQKINGFRLVSVILKINLL